MIEREEFETYLRGLPSGYNFCGQAGWAFVGRGEWCPLASFLHTVKQKSNASVSTSQITGIGVYPAPLLEDWQRAFVQMFDRRTQHASPTAGIALEVLGEISA